MFARTKKIKIGIMGYKMTYIYYIVYKYFLDDSLISKHN